MIADLHSPLFYDCLEFLYLHGGECCLYDYIIIFTGFHKIEITSGFNDIASGIAVAYGL